MQHESNENLDMGLDDEEILCENTGNSYYLLFLVIE